MKETFHCIKCKQLKNKTEFPRHKASTYGIEKKCKNCKKEDRKIYNDSNKDKIKKYANEYRLNNKNEISDYNRNYAMINRADITDRQRQYRNTPKGKAVALADCSNRTMALRDGDVTTIQMQTLIENSKNCFYCKIELSSFHVDHYIPISKGGRHTISNLVISCPKCNLKKGNKLPEISIQLEEVI